MSTETLAQVSNYSVASATVVIALAFLAHMAEWGFARKVTPEPVAVGAGGTTAAPESEESSADEDAVSRPDVLSSVGVSLTGLGTLLLLVGFVTRGLAADRVPWGNMYEFGIGGAAFALVVYLVMVAWQGLQWLGGIITGFALVVLGMAMSTYVPAGPLVPALHSYWLVIHVAAVMLSGAFFLVGAAASVLFLIRRRAEQRGTVGGLLGRFPSSAVMDKVAYRVIAVGFPLWTFGALIAGPIWAHYAWGRYWGWDPKEVWAFITWVVYAGYLHARATAGWKGKRAAIIALVGFATFLFSYYGVNLFGSGLHSYAK
ncbi:c-type cytochrome biogenesis protein CcsB [Aeromicrobium sp. CTD01-1L150]|uniref:c-type cytochrome biogenesis protein CcsB n=1 Tax=Aeromicrobium sp. CTD01-1L150 TaxID=3341830 RepID=UPI0035C17109